MRINEEQLKNKLKSLPIKPDSSWQESTSNYLKKIIREDVPEDKKSRNIFTYLFYLFTLPNMSSKTKLLAGSVVGVIAALALGTTAYAANDSAPGDLLYPVDKAMESMKRIMLRDPKAKAEYEEDILDERLVEMKQLQNKNAEQAQLEQAGDEVEQQKTRTEERIREMEENDPNDNNNEEQEQIQNRYEEQKEEHNEIKEQNQNQQNKPEENDKSTSSVDDTPGEPGGVGVEIHQRPQDQDNQNDDAPQNQNQNGSGYN
ncbi:MAG: DUF5667 domain-containing protein [Candidatus Dojkabacteria bacterium]|nr:DUF5667 domain-containing protein [Candidatus Dojkabacteria bacterium]